MKKFKKVTILAKNDIAGTFSFSCGGKWCRGGKDFCLTVM